MLDRVVEGAGAKDNANDDIGLNLLGVQIQIDFIDITLCLQIVEAAHGGLLDVIHDDAHLALEEGGRDGLALDFV